MYVCRCSWIPEEASDPLLTGVRDGCKPSDVGAGTELGSSPKKDVLVSFLINLRQDSHLRRTTNEIMPPQGCL